MKNNKNRYCIVYNISTNCKPYMICLRHCNFNKYFYGWEFESIDNTDHVRYNLKYIKYASKYTVRKILLKIKNTIYKYLIKQYNLSNKQARIQINKDYKFTIVKYKKFLKDYNEFLLEEKMNIALE